MCTSPKIIINPVLISRGYDYSTIDTPDKVFRYHFRYGAFIPSEFYPCNMNVSHDNIDRFNAVSDDGDILPLYIEVPCGKCDSCILSKQMDMQQRLSLEQYAHEKLGFPTSYFITLTYNNKYLPSYGVCKEDVQKFFKRFRIYLKRHLNYSKPLRYALFSEYGNEHGRPHYHFILFGFNPLDVKIPIFALQDALAESWQMGFVHVKACHSNSFRYCSKYLLKYKSHPDGKNPNFYLTSNRHGGIGCTALQIPEFLQKMFTSKFMETTVLLNGIPYTFQIPNNVVDYYFQKCSKFYRTKLSRKLYTFLNFHRKFYGLLKYDAYKDVVRSIIRRNSLLDISFKDVEYQLNSKLPAFIPNQFPFLADIYIHALFDDTSSSLSSLNECLNHRDSLIEYLYLYQELKNSYVDLDLIAENDLYLQKIKQHSYVSKDIRDKSRDLLGYRCSVSVGSFRFRSSVDNQ